MESQQSVVLGSVRKVQQTFVKRVERVVRRFMLNFEGGPVRRIVTDPCFGDWTLKCRVDGTDTTLGRSVGGIMELEQEKNKFASPGVYDTVSSSRYPVGLDGLDLRKFYGVEIVWDEERNGMGYAVIRFECSNILIESGESKGHYTWLYTFS